MSNWDCVCKYFNKFYISWVNIFMNTSIVKNTENDVYFPTPEILP